MTDLRRISKWMYKDICPILFNRFDFLKSKNKKRVFDGFELNEKCMELVKPLQTNAYQ